MAKDWIKMRMDLPSHPKVVRILSATGSDKFRVIGGLHAVWSVFDIHSEDGELVGYTPETMDHIIGWDKFSAAMIAVGWLYYDGDKTLTMPDFEAHNGQSAKKRAEEAERKRKRRAEESCPQSVRNLSDKKSDKHRSREEEKRVRVDTTKDNVASKDATSDYSPEFEQAWKDKPRREGGNSKKAAHKAWKARIREGANVNDLVDGMERYRKFCEAKKIIGTDKVKMMATFWGPDEHYLESYSLGQPEVNSSPFGHEKVDQSALEELKRTLRQYQ